MNDKSDERLGCFLLILGVAILIVCTITGILPATINAIRHEITRPQAPASIEQQTSVGALTDINGDTAARLTGYELTFPKGTLDWRVTYASRCERCNSDRAYTAIEPTYWCQFADQRWLSCQPVISEVDR